MNKAELRKLYLARQKNLSAAERDERSERIAQAFFRDLDLSQVSFLHCFLPIAKFNEVDTANIFKRVWAEFPDIRTLVPRVNFETGIMESVVYSADDELVQNLWGIHEPMHKKTVPAINVDMVIAPGVCFDKRGHRVGYGKGFYDRFLGTCRPDCVKIGVSLFAPVEEISDIHDGDVQLEFVVTPDEILTGKA
ncbi:MAG TPA: 5-formyltetrahydrofolate cyclo-ligase [Pyrinomonadaceae bacterium]|nr:5-formyltetrahydrofolate cyclo-ligase [Pyrinomonadaceae bacterium]